MRTEVDYRDRYDPPPAGPGSGRLDRLDRLGAGRLGRWRTQATGAVALVAAWLMMTALGPALGLLVIVLLWLLVRSLGAHLDEGGRRQWLRALKDYAVVAALVVVVLGVAPALAPPKPKPDAPPAATDQAKVTAADPWAKLRARWDRLVDRFSVEAPVIQLGDESKPKDKP
jgi:hypothetical protein